MPEDVRGYAGHGMLGFPRLRSWMPNSDSRVEVPIPSEGYRRLSDVPLPAVWDTAGLVGQCEIPSDSLECNPHGP